MSGMNIKNTAMNTEEIRQLLEKYYEGTSTSEDELLLKKFFSGQDIPEDLSDEKEIFRHYAQLAEVPEPSTGFEENLISAIDTEERGIERFKKRRLFITLSGTAAAILILAGSYFFFTSRSEIHDTYSDPEVAYTEAMKILYKVSSQLNQGTKALGHLSALQIEAQKTVTTVSRSTAVIGEKMKPLDNLFDAIGKASNNYEKK